ncbi:MAG: nucleotidyltransferase [Clostridia bacterium]|nr:nucleotidyltransferase [Clostridia bacterium]
MNYGIICEYNPFHNGHLYQINKTKSENDNLICVMSGQYVQRGCPALFDKWTRATWAVQNGANLVLELPTFFSTASAEYFAKGAVSILENLGICDFLSFGCEDDNTEKLEEIARILISDEYSKKLKSYLDSGESYAKARQKTVEFLLKEDATLLEKPNNILAIEYIKAILSLGSDIKPFGVKRAFISHDSAEECGDFTSASNIREKILNNTFDFSFIPENIRQDMEEKISGGQICNMEEFYDLCYKKLLLTSEHELSENPYVSEGLENKFIKELSNSTDYNSLLEKVKSKRYAHSRLRRIMISNLLGIKKEDIESSPSYIRVLAFDEKGKELLKSAKKKSALPIITKPSHIKNCNEKAIADFEKEKRFTNLSFSFYNTPRENNLDFITSPIFIK